MEIDKVVELVSQLEIYLVDSSVPCSVDNLVGWMDKRLAGMLAEWLA
jgi:fructose-1-phosphate kinase PfkB-like protein